MQRRQNAISPTPSEQVVVQTVTTNDINTQPVEGKPVRIQIPSLGIDLPVIDGYYNARERSWTLTNTKAQYATITPKANNIAGNTFVYGHRLHNVFGHLDQITSGAKAVITTDNGHTFTYTFRSSRETSPNDDSLFRYQGAPILTLQTCSGAWDQNRRLFTFDFTGVV